MIAITSIAPGHKNFDSQFKAIQSWQDAGYHVVSLNSEEEIKELWEFGALHVQFVKTIRHNKAIFGKPYVTVSAIIDYLKEVKSTYSLIVNSDIIIKDPGGVTESLKNHSENGIVIMNRRDFLEDINNSQLYEHGFDGFFINGKYLDIFPQTILCLGQCHWDFWLPYIASRYGTKILKLREPYLYHLKHNTQYSKKDWEKTEQIFQGEVGLTNYRRTGEVSNHTYKFIKAHLR